MPRGSSRYGWSSAIALLLALPLVRALYEDEVGQHEWILQQIGKPTALAFSGDAPDRIFAASASGVIASMSMKDGKVQWRRVTAPETGVHLLRTVDKGLISASDGGNVQAWKGNGDLLWQRAAEGEVVDLLIAGKQNVVIVGQFEVEARNLIGKHEWSTKSDGKASFRAAAISESDGHICVVKVAGSMAMAQKLEATTGKVVSEEEMPAEAADGISSGDFIVVDANLVVLANGKLSAFPFCGGEPDSLDLSEVKGQGPHKLQPWQRTRGVFAITDGSQSKTTIFGIGQK